MKNKVLIFGCLLTATLGLRGMEEENYDSSKKRDRIKELEEENNTLKKAIESLRRERADTKCRLFVHKIFGCSCPTAELFYSTRRYV